MRQPHARNAASSIDTDSKVMMPDARHKPIANPICG